MKKYKFGMISFLESGVNEVSGKIDAQTRIKHALEEVKLADEVGLSFYGVGEHHRSDYASTAPQIILAAAASMTKQIKLGTAVTVLSSDDPIRLYEQFSTLDLISDGRSEIMVGRGSFIESFELFGYDLDDYDHLFTEKLDLLLKARDDEKINWQGRHRNPVVNKTAYPRDSYDLKISIGVGGTYQSVVRAATLGLPIVFAIIGGNPMNFKPLIDLYKKTYEDKGHDLDNMEISVAMHGMVYHDKEKLLETYFPSYKDHFEKIGKERGWQNSINKHNFIANTKHGALVVGDPGDVTNRIYEIVSGLGIQRFLYQMPGSIMPHEMTLESIRLYGEEVVPEVLKRLEKA